MSRPLSSHSSLDVLRGEAKRWLKAITAADTEALARFRRAVPDRAGVPKLREVQHALAREYGFPSWAALKQELEDRARSAGERIRLFLEESVNRYGVSPFTRKWGDYELDGPPRGAVAARILARHPEIVRDSIHTAVAAHDLDAVRGFLQKSAALANDVANDRSAFDGWTPLLRLAYVRLPIEAVCANALEIATLLLDAGADPNAGWTDSANEFTVLVGVIGGGEGGQAAHPLAEAFARLLIARGADPFAPQALYNTSLGADSTFWLDLLWSESEKRGETSKWTGPAPQELGGEKMTSALDYLLGNAVPRHVQRTRWLLEHGADARAISLYSREPVIKNALLAGSEEMAELLERHGANRPELSDYEKFLAATVAGDFAPMRQLAVSHPEFLQRYDAMVAAIRTFRADIVQALLDLGMSPDVGDDKNCRALHYAAHCGATEVARLLIARGAEVDPFELRYGGAPIMHALYHQQQDMVDLLIPHTSNFRSLCVAGGVEKLREMLTREPDRANREDRPGEPALFCLPTDEEKALEIAELLLSFGADPTFRNPLGQTPAQVARRRGLDDVAVLLEEAERRTPT
jgi:ankyrin repeat protein